MALSFNSGVKKRFQTSKGCLTWFRYRVWSNYSDLTQPISPQNVAFWKGNPGNGTPYFREIQVDVKYYFIWPDRVSIYRPLRFKVLRQSQISQGTWDSPLSFFKNRRIPTKTVQNCVLPDFFGRLLSQRCITLRIIGPSRLTILRTLPLLYRFKPFHWRVQDP